MNLKLLFKKIKFSLKKKQDVSSGLTQIHKVCLLTININNTELDIKPPKYSNNTVVMLCVNINLICV